MICGIKGMAGSKIHIKKQHSVLKTRKLAIQPKAQDSDIVYTTWDQKGIYYLSNPFAKMLFSF